MTVRDYSAPFLKVICANVASGSARIYRDSVGLLCQRIGDREVDSITVDDIRDHILWLRNERGNSNRWIKLQKGVARRLFRWLIDEGVLPEERILMFMARRLPKTTLSPAVKHPITRHQHEAILRSVRDRRLRYWWTTTCIIAWNTGLRLSDVAYFRWDCIDWEEEMISLTPIKTRRLEKTVTIPMEPELVEHLLEKRANPYYVSEYVVPDMKGFFDHHQGSLSCDFLGICRHVGFNNISFHSYRHAFVSRLMNAGVTPKIISTMTGQTVQQIMEYTHISPEAQREAMKKARQQLHAASLATLGIFRPTTYQADPLPEMQSV